MRYYDHERVILRGDQQTCFDCGQTWDANDPCPPACQTQVSDRVAWQIALTLLAWLAIGLGLCLL